MHNTFFKCVSWRKRVKLIHKCIIFTHIIRVTSYNTFVDVLLLNALNRDTLTVFEIHALYDYLHISLNNTRRNATHKIELMHEKSTHFKYIKKQSLLQPFITLKSLLYLAHRTTIRCFKTKHNIRIVFFDNFCEVIFYWASFWEYCMQ